MGRGRRTKKAQQLDLSLPPRWTHGGARKGAGRKPKARSGVSHGARPEHHANHPVHVTIRLVRAVGNCRKKRRFMAIRDAIKAATERADFSVVHWSVQTNHLHLVVEAEGKRSLWKGMQSLGMRVAKALNRLLGRSGAVYADRYHSRALTSPREVRNALLYVLQNRRKHLAQGGHSGPPRKIDICSSAPWFDGWRPGTCAPLDPEERAWTDTDPPRSEARTWLLRVGWRLRGLLTPDLVPGS